MRPVPYRILSSMKSPRPSSPLFDKILERKTKLWRNFNPAEGFRRPTGRDIYDMAISEYEDIMGKRQVEEHLAELRAKRSQEGR